MFSKKVGKKLSVGDIQKLCFTHAQASNVSLTREQARGMRNGILRIEPTWEVRVLEKDGRYYVMDSEPFDLNRDQILEKGFKVVIP